MKKGNILIFGNYEGINLGDEIILKALLSKISPSKWDIFLASSNLEYLKKNYKINIVPPLPFGIRSLFRGNFLKIIQAIRKADLVIFGGGGLFQDREKGAFAMWSFFLKTCLFFARRVILIGNSFDINRQANIKKAKKLFSKISFFSVRDKASQEFLEKIGVRKEKIVLATDCAFLLPKKIAKRRKKQILLILHGQYTSDKQIKRIKAFVKGKKAVLVPMQSRISFDDKLAKKLGVECVYPENLDELRKIISVSQFVLTSRLHGAILSILSTTPFLAFSPMNKLKNFLLPLGLNKFFIQENFTKKSLEKSYSESIKKAVVIRKELRKVADREKKEAKNILPEFI